MSHDFKIVNENFGKGMHSRVSLVKRKSDGKLFVWKRLRSENQVHKDSFRDEPDRSKFWREIGVSKVEVQWYSDGKSLIKTYIKGDTLSEKLKKDRHFFSRTDKKSLKALKELFGQLIKSGHWVRDLSAKNLVFDGDRWHVIDSSYICKMESLQATRNKYKEELVEMWSKKPKRKVSSKDMDSIRSFFDSIS